MTKLTGAEGVALVEQEGRDAATDALVVVVDHGEEGRGALDLQDLFLDVDERLVLVLHHASEVDTRRDEVSRHQAEREEPERERVELTSQEPREGAPPPELHSHLNEPDHDERRAHHSEDSDVRQAARRDVNGEAPIGP